jgi:hypothetical protein
MAEQKKAPLEGPNGVDAWTSNGYGLVIGGKQVKPLAEEDDTEIEEIEEE